MCIFNVDFSLDNGRCALYPVLVIAINCDVFRPGSGHTVHKFSSPPQKQTSHVSIPFTEADFTCFYSVHRSAEASVEAEAPVADTAASVWPLTISFSSADKHTHDRVLMQRPHFHNETGTTHNERPIHWYMPNTRADNIIRNSLVDSCRNFRHRSPSTTTAHHHLHHRSRHHQ